jgi:hypothetical protein
MSLAANLGRSLSPEAVRRLAAAGVGVPTDPQALLNTSLRAGMLQAAIRAVAASIPSGPHHAARVADTMQQVQQLIDETVAGLRLTLAGAIQHGLMMVLVFCGLACLATIFAVDSLPRR